MAGGTGGHVFPALAVAENLRARGVEVIWLGTRSGLEARTVPAAGFEIEWINIKGVRGKGWMGWMIMPVQLIRAVIQAVEVVRRRRPGALLGMGGFVAGPGGVAARILGRPLLIHEANALAGMTNQWLSRIATRVMTGFPGTFKSSVHEEHVGNPVRPEISALAPPAQRWREPVDTLRILVIGGSQGARALNNQLPDIFASTLKQERSIEVWHQTGSVQRDQIEQHYRTIGVEATVESFIEDMAGAYAWAHLVLCRSGAMTVAEVSAAGIASVLIPFPDAVGDHQTANARYLADQDAARLVPQSELGTQLPGILSDFCKNPQQLLEIAERARALAIPGATQAVADICVESFDA